MSATPLAGSHIHRQILMSQFIQLAFLDCYFFSCKSTVTAVIGVHHSGKDINRGMRGSSALLGAVDTSIKVKNTDGLICLKTLKQKDQAEHPPIYLKMKEIALVDGSSVALDLISGNGDKNPIKRPKFGSTRQYAAYQALRICGNRCTKEFVEMSVYRN